MMLILLIALYYLKVNTLLETEEERAKLFDALRNYHE